MNLSTADKESLREIAWRSIRYALQHQSKLEIMDLDPFSPPLEHAGASFVSLHKHNELRGCVGSLEAERPLVVDVNHNAYAAAFSDPRFPSVVAEELDYISLEISVLSEAIPMQFESEQDLLRQLRPNIDGIILSEGHRRATFLPIVWEQLTEPREFLGQLKLKAGLPGDYWSETVCVERYGTVSF